jgi:fibronectin type 3 domain-containing protein
VRAADAAGNLSGYSAIVTATTSSVPPNGTATLTWDAVTAANLSGYRMYSGTAPGTYFQPLGQGVNVGNVTTFMATGLTRGIRYYFVMTAFDTANNESIFSNEVFKDIP